MQPDRFQTLIHLHVRNSEFLRKTYGFGETGACKIESQWDFQKSKKNFSEILSEYATGCHLNPISCPIFWDHYKRLKRKFSFQSFDRTIRAASQGIAVIWIKKGIESCCGLKSLNVHTFFKRVCNMCANRLA